MPSADPTITLLQLGLRGEPMSFAPHVWKTLLPLRLLQIPFKVELVTLRELREELPSRLAVEKVTLPILLIEEVGTCSFIMDSYRIALWLDQRFGAAEKSLFGTFQDASQHTGQAFARFIETWVDRSLAATLRPCVLHASYAHFPEDETPYFLAKCGQAKMDELTALNADEGWMKQTYEESRKQFEIVETLLSERKQHGEQGIFLGGARPLHPDFAVFAFYPYALINASLVRNTWRHPSLPFVGRWLDAMLNSGLVDRSELLPESWEEEPLV